MQEQIGFRLRLAKKCSGQTDPPMLFQVAQVIVLRTP